MIIIDTSVWIEFFRRNDLYFSEIRANVENQNVLALEPVFAELLQGVKGRREKELVEQYWKFLPKVAIDEIWIKAGNLSSEKRLIQLGVGLIDSCILVCAMETKSQIWSLDKKLLKVIPDKLVYIQKMA